MEFRYDVGNEMTIKKSGGKKANVATGSAIIQSSVIKQQHSD